jgi:hypothetical protein
MPRKEEVSVDAWNGDGGNKLSGRKGTLPKA